MKKFIASVAVLCTAVLMLAACKPSAAAVQPASPTPQEQAEDPLTAKFHEISDKITVQNIEIAGQRQMLLFVPVDGPREETDAMGKALAEQIDKTVKDASASIHAIQCSFIQAGKPMVIVYTDKDGAQVFNYKEEKNSDMTGNTSADEHTDKTTGKNSADEQPKTQAGKTPDKTDKNYSLNETWEVPDLFRLTVTAVEVTDERNQFSEREPQQVVAIHYTYENLGYESEIQDLFITPDKVVDGQGKMAETYPVMIGKMPQPAPIGASCDATEVYALDNESQTIKVYFQIYGKDFDKHKACFEVPVNTGSTDNA